MVFGFLMACWRRYLAELRARAPLTRVVVCCLSLLSAHVAHAAVVFNEDFNGTALDSSKWREYRYGSETVSVASGNAHFGSKTFASTCGKYTFLGTGGIVVESRMAGQGGNRDTYMELVEVATGNSIRVGDTNYFGMGLYTYGSGLFSAGQAGNGTSVSGLMEYRFTANGTSVTIERGATLANITETRTITVPTSIAGKTFFLGIGTGGPDYQPGDFDWVRVNAALGLVNTTCTASGYTSGPVSHYPLDGNANDIGTNGNNGTPAGSVSFAGGTYANFNPVATDGSGWITAAPPINRDTSMSFAVWLRPSYIDAGGLGIVYERALGGGDSCGINSAGNFAVEITTGKFAFATSTLSGATCTWSRTFSTTVPQIGQWTHVAGAYDKAGTRKIYINGVLESTAAVGTSLRTVSGATLRIGRNEVSVASQVFHGDMDDLRFYDRVLTAAEIAAFSAVVPVRLSTLNDTGITFCGGATTGNNSPCLASDPAGQDKYYGRDSAAAAGNLNKVGSSAGAVGGGANGFDFSKITNDGSVLSAAATPLATIGGTAPNDWACTRDNVTGLIWEVKTTSGLRSQSHTYTWYQTGSPDGSNGVVSGGACQTAGRCDTEKFVQDVNAAGLCGTTSGWRMPSVKELEGVADLGRFDPAIDPMYFPNTPSSFVWTNAPYALRSSDSWFVYSQNGYASSYARSSLSSVRLVRSGQ